MTGIRRLASLPVAAVAILSLLAAALTFTPPQILEAQGETQAPARPTGLSVAVNGQSVTLAWTNPNDSTITRYEYGVNHNDTSTGKLSGWQWTTIPNSGASTTSHTIDDLTGGKEYRFKIRAVNDLGNSKPAPAASPWYVSVTIPDLSPPALSDLWTVRVCDDLFKVRWNFVPGATGYDLEMSGDHRQSWQRKMTNQNVNAWQFSQWTKNATFWFRVRTVNAHGASEWRYVKSIAPPCRVEGVQATHLPSAGGQSGTISVSWDAAHRAIGYDVNFTADNGRSWQRMVTDLRATSYEFTKHIPYNSNYRVAVQARRKGVTGGWTNAPIAPAGGRDSSRDFNTLSAAGQGKPYGIWSDGTTMWVSNSATSSRKVFAYNLATKARDTGKDIAATHSTTNNNTKRPEGITSDGATMWVSDYSSYTTVYAYKLSDQSRDSSKDLTLHTDNTWALSLWTNGVTIWVGDEADDYIYAYTIATGARDTGKEIDLHSDNGDVNGLWSDGVTMWVLDLTDRKIYAYQMSDESRDSAKDYSLDSQNADARGIWSDGATMWVSDDGDDKLYAYHSMSPGAKFTTLAVAPTTATLYLGAYAGSWYYQANAGPDSSCSTTAQTGSNLNLTGLTAGTEYTYKAYDQSGCNSADEIASATFTTPASLTASAITSATATLTIAGHNGNWHYQANTGPDSSCSSTAQTGTTLNLTGLTAGTEYTYTAYDQSGCASANEIAAVTFTTPGVSVSSLGNNRNGHEAVGTNIGAQRKAAAQFTTGGNSDGYDLSSVTIDIDRIVGSPGGLTVAIYSNGTNNKPNASLTTLSGSNPTGAGQFTYTCSSSCSLSANTKYHLVLEAPSASGNYNNYGWESSSSGAEVTVPSNNGWSIGESFEHSYSVWGDISRYVKFKVSATLPATLTATNVTYKGATLTIGNHYGDWYYQADTGPDSSCSSTAQTGTTLDLTGLTKNTTYTYTAYDESGCNSADEIVAVTFTTPLPTPGSRDSSQDFNTLTAAGNASPDGLWSDGTTMWVSDTGDNKVYAYTLATKARDAGKDNSLSGNTLHIAMGADGTTMWTADLIATGKLFAYTIATGARDTSKDITLHTDNDNIYALWANSATIWVGDDTDNHIYAYTTATGTRDTSKEFDLHADNGDVNGLWSDGTTMWITDSEDYKLYAYNLSDGSRDSAKDYASLDSANTAPVDIWSDGTRMWVADSTDSKLYAYHSMSPGAKLTTLAVAPTTATLYLGAYAGSWYYQANAAPHLACSSSAQAGATLDLTGLTAGTQYTYKAYDKSGCDSADEIASVTFTTPGVSVSNLGNIRDGNVVIGIFGTNNPLPQKVAGQFTTGGNSGGYELSSVTIEIDGMEGSPGNLTVAIYSNGANNKPGTSQITLSGSNPTGAGQYIYTCATTCTLSANTKYHLVLDAPNASTNPSEYQWEYSSSGSEVAVPSNNGWSIGGVSTHFSGSWSAISNYVKFKVSATAN